MKKIRRTLFNRILLLFLITTILFSVIIFFKQDGNVLLFIVAYIITLMIIFLSYIGDLNDIEYNELKVRFTNSFSGKVKEIFLTDLKSVNTEVVTAAGFLIVFQYRNDAKDKYGTIGCDLNEIDEMVHFINKRIEEIKKEDE